MATVNVYLTFNGNCKQAFEFYRSVFGGDFPYVGTYGEMPVPDGAPPIPEEMKDRIMHVTLPISKETYLMGSDAGGAWSKDVVVGNNFSISISPDSREQADKFFNALAEGGTITMPLEDTFWEAYYGMLIDKFGINWMVNFENPKHQEFEESNRAPSES